MPNAERVYFHQRPTGDKLYFRGRIYDGPVGKPQEEDLAELLRRPEELNGREADLAVVGYEARRGRWRLLRDFGPTPLYYAQLPDGFAWSFTYSGLLDLLEDPRPDQATLFDYLATHYRYIFRDPGRTFHQEARQVPAGCYLDFDEQGARLHSWLDLGPDPDLAALGPEEATEGLMSRLRRSVKLRAADQGGRAAFTVSSGLDSATVASLAAGNLGSIDVYSVGYSGPDSREYDETEGVAELTRGRDWRWTHLRLDCPDLIADTKELIRRGRSPVITVTWLAYYLMTKLLRGYNRIFNGLGGDECLAGEFGHFFYFFADLKRTGDEDRLASEVEAWSRLHDHPVFKKNPQALARFWERNIDFTTGQMRADPEMYSANWRFFDPDWLAAGDPGPPPMPRPYPDFLSNRLYQETTYETTPPTLWGLHLANQSQGLSGVSPFLTPGLFKYCLSLPGPVKYDRGLTKALLRRGLKGVLPESLRLNPKKIGFNAPIHQWFRESKVAGPLREMLESGPLARRGWLKKGAAEEIFREHESGQANHMMLLWALLNTSLFLGQSDCRKDRGLSDS